MATAAKTARPAYVQLALVLGILSAFGPLSIDMYLPGLPTIAREFGADPASTQLTLSLFLLGTALGQTIYGPLSDRFGRRVPLLVGCGLYAAASLGCALTPSIGGLIWLRLLQALGGCVGMVISRSVVRDLFDARESARMYSFLMLVMGVAPITAPLIGGQLLLAFGWRSVFLVLAGFGLLCLALVALALPESLPPERRVTIRPGAVLTIYGGLLRDRQFLGYALAGGLVGASMFAYISGSSFVFIELYGVAPDRFGWIFGSNAFGLIMASQINRRLLLRFSSATILRNALSVIGLSAAILLAVAATGFGGLPGLLLPLFVCIAGYGFVTPNATAMGMAPHGKVAGSASALLGTIQSAVGAGSGILVGLLYNGTALPMAGVIAACVALAAASFYGLVRRSGA